MWNPIWTKRAALGIAALVACNETAPLPDEEGEEASPRLPADDPLAVGGALPEPPEDLEDPNWEILGVTTWPENRKGAYTIFHDDLCNPGLNNMVDIGVSELNKRGLVASFGAIAQMCVENESWSTLKEMVDAGHEIANHSWSHPDLTLGMTDIMLQIDDARAALEEGLGGTEVSFFIFPLDSFNGRLLEHLGAQGYLGARAGARGINDGDFDDPLRIQFDVYGPGFSNYAQASGTPCFDHPAGARWSDASRECRRYIMDDYVEDVIRIGGYGLRELHSIEGQGWEAIPEDEYIEHLDFVKEKVDAGELWMATASDVVRYRQSRANCATPWVSADSLVYQPRDSCKDVATIQTLIIAPKEGSVDTLSATQQGQEVPVQEGEDGSFWVTVHPTAGDIELSVN